MTQIVQAHQDTIVGVFFVIPPKYFQSDSMQGDKGKSVMFFWI